MNIDVSKIVNDKIAELESTGVIQKSIEETVEKVVLKEICEGLDNYELRRSISNAVKTSVSEIADTINFSAYNGFIAQTIKNITEGTLREDLAQKIQRSFEEIMLVKHENVKLSEIFEKYYKWVCEHTEESEKWERQEFTHSLEVKEDGEFKHIKAIFSDEVVDRYGTADIEITFCDYKNKGISNIGNLYIEGKNVNERIKFGRTNDFETYLLSLFLNKTEIILDFDDVEENGYYDIDN